MSTWNLAGGSVKISNVVVGHKFTALDINEKPITRETLHAGNTPYPTVELIGKKVEGDVSFILDSANTFPTVAVSSAPLTVTGPGVKFDGNVSITEFSIKAGVEADKPAEASLKFNSIDGAYTFAKS